MLFVKPQTPITLKYVAIPELPTSSKPPFTAYSISEFTHNKADNTCTWPEGNAWQIQQAMASAIGRAETAKAGKSRYPSKGSNTKQMSLSCAQFMVYALDPKTKEAD